MKLQLVKIRLLTLGLLFSGGASTFLMGSDDILLKKPIASTATATASSVKSEKSKKEEEGAVTFSYGAENKELSNDELNRIFLSFYEEWKLKQKARALEKKKAKTSKQEGVGAVINNQRTPLASSGKKIKINTQEDKKRLKTLSMEEQMTYFLNSQKENKKATTPQPQYVPPKKIPKAKIYGVFCEKGKCYLYTEVGVKKKGDKVNGKTIVTLTQESVKYKNGEVDYFTPYRPSSSTRGR